MQYSRSVISVLATEMTFRKKWHRRGEILYWVALWIIKSKRLEELTVGISQIKLKHWHNLGYISSYQPSYENIKLITNILVNYNACNQFLREILPQTIGSNSERKIVEYYAGRPRKYYVRTISKALSILDGIKMKKSFFID